MRVTMIALCTHGESVVPGEVSCLIVYERMKKVGKAEKRGAQLQQGLRGIANIHNDKCTARHRAQLCYAFVSLDLCPSTLYSAHELAVGSSASVTEACWSPV